MRVSCLWLPDQPCWGGVGVSETEVKWTGVDTVVTTGHRACCARGSQSEGSVAKEVVATGKRVPRLSGQLQRLWLGWRDCLHLFDGILRTQICWGRGVSTPFSTIDDSWHKCVGRAVLGRSRHGYGELWLRLYNLPFAFIQTQIQVPTCLTFLVTGWLTDWLSFRFVSWSHKM